MRTPKQAYNEAMGILLLRNQKADQTIVAHKESYKLGLHVAIEQLKLSFHGVFDQVASTQEDQGLAMLDRAEAQAPQKTRLHHVCAGCVFPGLACAACEVANQPTSRPALQRAFEESLEPDFHSDPGNFVMPAWLPTNEELDNYEGMIKPE